MAGKIEKKITQDNRTMCLCILDYINTYKLIKYLNIMTTNFPNNNYLISIVEPVDKGGHRQSLRVQVYERLDPFDHSTPALTPGVQHVKFIDDFSLWEGQGYLSLEEVTKKVEEVVASQRSSVRLR